jgi:hypothetical protein
LLVLTVRAVSSRAEDMNMVYGLRGGEFTSFSAFRLNRV